MKHKTSKLHPNARNTRPKRQIGATYYISTEGSTTEFQYFSLFKKFGHIVQVNTGHKSDPKMF